MTYNCHNMFGTFGPRPHFLGYVSLSIMTRLILATTPWSHADITAVVIRAIPGKYQDKSVIFFQHTQWKMQKIIKDKTKTLGYQTIFWVFYLRVIHFSTFWNSHIVHVHTVHVAIQHSETLHIHVYMYIVSSKRRWTTNLQLFSFLLLGKAWFHYKIL